MVLIVSYVQLFGVAVIFLLIASHNVDSLLRHYIGKHFVLHFCDWTIFVTVLMVPISMFGTPKDFWPIAVNIVKFYLKKLKFIPKIVTSTFTSKKNNSFKLNMLLLSKEV